MTTVPYVDIHTHSFQKEKETVLVQNIYPGEEFAVFSGRNFYSTGLHPWHIKTENENNEALQIVEAALEFGHVICVGETGLDKLRDTDFKEQQRVFEAQAYIAEEYQYPLIIHCVKAVNEVIELRKKMDPAMAWIMHAYNGSPEQTKQLLELGFMFSFGKGLFRQQSKGIESFKQIPLNKLFFETDNSEQEVEEIYKQGALLKEIPLDILKLAVWENFNRIENSLNAQA